MNLSSSQRFLSLDVLRGLTICFMIIVNTSAPGVQAYPPLEHAHWFGFTPTDLVFPTFMFVVGNAMSFSMKKYIQQGSAAFWKKVVKRTIIIFLLGYLMYWFPFFYFTDSGQWAWKPFSHTRIMGVLQRIALGYFFGSLIVYYLSQRAATLLSIAILLGYWGLLYLFGDPQAPLSMTGNAVLKLDRWLFGDNHLYHGEGIPFDPEGVLSTLPAIVNVVWGYYAGKFIQEKGKTYETIAKLMMVGAILCFIALFWNQSFPIAKKLWTSSFVLYTVGLDLLILGPLMYGLELRTDLAQRPVMRKLTYFFEVFGRNPLFIYLVSELLIEILWMIPVGEDDLPQWVSDHIFQKIAAGAFGGLLYSLTYMGICWLVGYFLDRKKIYIKV
ncbi:MAG: heparan-alpha-glucosaminide N-acetyltransferase domain-containing protein [Thermoflavifilum sp.]|nr:heparan-alpha-glucosaminide N-acetyltransferase domain-containing protein [Thermoflavifilum sp.]